MKKYILKYKNSDNIKYDVHPSWCELCEKQTKDKIINLLKKHLFEPDEYTLSFSVNHSGTKKGEIRHKTQQIFFEVSVMQKNDQLPGGALWIGFIRFDYCDDTFKNYDFKNSFPIIDCEKEPLNPNPKFTVSTVGLTISPKELEISCQKSAERFMARIYDSVNFPLEIDCDYPDVIFEICYGVKLDQDLVTNTLKIIEEYAAKYNKRHEDGIHYVADVSDITESKKRNAVYIHVDFGNCDINALALVIKAIGKSNLPIKEMTLK